MSMSIKKSKTNEAQPDFDDMMSEVEEELEVQQIEQNIADRVPELGKLSENIDKATTAVINAKLSLNLQSAKPSVKKECSVLP